MARPGLYIGIAMGLCILPIHLVLTFILCHFDFYSTPDNDWTDKCVPATSPVPLAQNAQDCTTCILIWLTPLSVLLYIYCVLCIPKNSILVNSKHSQTRLHHKMNEKWKFSEMLGTQITFYVL